MLLNNSNNYYYLQQQQLGVGMEQQHKQEPTSVLQATGIELNKNNEIISKIKYRKIKIRDNNNNNNNRAKKSKSLNFNSKKLTSTIEYDQNLATQIHNELGLFKLKNQNDAQNNRLPVNASLRYPWGNLTYAEIIQRAIETSQFKRLTLSQIYDWFIKYVPYFKNKIDKKSSFGWKNSIRHNLSLHKKFQRMQNTEFGKSSWWTVDSTLSSNDLHLFTQQSMLTTPTPTLPLTSTSSLPSSAASNYSENSNMTNGVTNSGINEANPVSYCNRCNNLNKCICHYNSSTAVISTSSSPNKCEYQQNLLNKVQQKLDSNTYTQPNNFDWDLDVNEIICYERTLNGGELDFNKEYMFNFIENIQPSY